MYRIDLAVVSSLYGLQSACVKHMRQCVSSRLRTVEYSRVSLQDAAKRCVVRLAHVAPLCVASVLSYKKVSKGSEFLPGYAMQAPGLVDIKRRRRVASRVLHSGTHRGDTARTRSIERLPSPEQGHDIVVVVADCRSNGRLCPSRGAVSTLRASSSFARQVFPSEAPLAPFLGN